MFGRQNSELEVIIAAQMTCRGNREFRQEIWPLTPRGIYLDMHVDHHILEYISLKAQIGNTACRFRYLTKIIIILSFNWFWFCSFVH